MALDLNDKTVNGNTLTNNNGVSDYTSSLPFGAKSHAADFLGSSSQFFSATSSSTLKPTGVFTIEFWIKTTEASAKNIIQSYSSLGVKVAGWTINYDSSGKIDFYSGTDTGVVLNTDYQHILSNGSVNDGSWHHVACVYTGSKLQIYIDGSFDNEVAWASGPVYQATSYFRIGCDNNTGGDGAFATAQLTEIRIWGTNRSSTEIANNRSIELVGNEASLNAYWPFESLSSSSSSISPSPSRSASLSPSLSPSLSLSSSVSPSPSLSISFSPSASLSPSSSISPSPSLSLSPSPSLSISASSSSSVSPSSPPPGITFAYLQSANSGSDTATYTFTAQNLGSAATDRHIIVSTLSRHTGSSLSTIDSVTVGGITSTIVRQKQNSPSNGTMAGIAIVAVPTGTTGDVVITFNRSQIRCGIGLYRVIGLTNTTPTDTGDSTANSPTYDIDVAAGGFAVGAATSAQNGTTATWAGITEDFDFVVEFSAMFGASSTFVTTQTNLTVTCTPTTAIDPVGVFASWGNPGSSTSASVSPSPSLSISRSPSLSVSSTPSPSLSLSPSLSPSSTPSASPSASPSSSVSASYSSSISPSPSPSSYQEKYVTNPRDYSDKYSTTDKTYTDKYPATTKTYSPKYREFD